MLASVRRALYVECGVPPPTTEEEAAQVLACFRSFRAARSAAGDEWFVVPGPWWFAWVAATGFQATEAQTGGAIGSAAMSRETVSAPQPASLGPIDTLSLLVRFVAPGGIAARGSAAASWSAAPVLRPGLSLASSLAVDGSSGDVVVLPPRVWRALAAWYGVRGPPIARQVVLPPSRGGAPPSQPALELNPRWVRVRRMLPPTGAPGVPVSPVGGPPVLVPVANPSPVVAAPSTPSRALATTPVATAPLVVEGGCSAADSDAAGSHCTGVFEIDADAGASVFTFSRFTPIAAVIDALAAALNLRGAGAVRIWLQSSLPPADGPSPTGSSPSTQWPLVPIPRTKGAITAAKFQAASVHSGSEAPPPESREPVLLSETAPPILDGDVIVADTMTGEGEWISIALGLPSAADAPPPRGGAPPPSMGQAGADAAAAQSRPRTLDLSVPCVPPALVGFVNMGNTCYLASALQVRKAQGGRPEAGSAVARVRP